MHKIKLSGTHQRILANLLFVLEQKIENIELIIKRKSTHASYSIEKDLKEQEISRILGNCNKLKDKISEIYGAIDLKKRKIDEYQYVNTLQSQMWELISDAYSDKLKGYGEELRNDAKKVDPYINELSQIINQLKLLNNINS